MNFFAGLIFSITICILSSSSSTLSLNAQWTHLDRESAQNHLSNNEDPKCAQSDYSYIDASMDDTSHVTSRWETCGFFCFLIPNCGGWSWNSNRDLCFLKVSSDNLKEDPGWISGPKNCYQ